MPVYRLKLGEKKHIVVANLASQAIRHVFRKQVECETLTAEELAKEIVGGAVLEHADTSVADPVVPASMGDPFKHKIACGASGATPIGGPGCKCMHLPME